MPKLKNLEKSKPNIWGNIKQENYQFEFNIDSKVIKEPEVVVDVYILATQNNE